MANNRKYSYNEEEKATPKVKLNEERSFIKFVIFGILTLGIYDIVLYISISFDINKIASRHDGKKTMNYLFSEILAYFTFSIVQIIWYYQFTERVSDELNRRQIDYELDTSDFWGWMIFGSLILIGPFVYHYKVIKAMNLLCASYNKETENS